MDDETRDKSAPSEPTSGEVSADQDAHAQETRRFVPRSPLDDLSTAESDSAADALTDGTQEMQEAAASADEPLSGEGSDDDAAADVISLPAHSDDLADAAEPAGAEEDISGPPPVPTPPPGRTAAQWLSRFKSFSHPSETGTPAPAGEEMREEAATHVRTVELPRRTEAAAAGQASEDESHESLTGEATAHGEGDPSTDSGDDTTVCPVCGNETSALRFCGYCGAPLGAARAAAESHSRVAEMRRRLRGMIDPAHRLITALPHAITLLAGAVIILIALLANSAGVALIVTSAIVPILILLTLNQQDVFEEEPPLILLGVGLAGGIAGLIVGGIGAWLHSRSWFDTGVLNYGAGGFGGRFAEAAGASPFLVWLGNGVILPLLGLAGMLAAPIALRRLNQFRNEVMDGMILAGSAAAGFAIGSAIVFWAPIFTHAGPRIDVSDWTLMVIGMGILRPLIIGLSGAMLGAGIWRYMMVPKQRVLILPAAGGIGGMVLLYLGSIWIQPSGGGLWPEVLWLVLIAVAVAIVFRLVLTSSITEDRKALGSDGTRIVCPHCHRLTLKGSFCSRCGKPLAGASTARRDAPAAVS